MPTAVFIQDGINIDYTPAPGGADVAAGDVLVLADLIGIARLDIKAGKLGALAVRGVFELPKATGAGTDIPNGTKVYWDAALKQVTAISGGAGGSGSGSGGSGSGRPLIGKAVRAATTTDAKVRVMLTP
jgi:predicted RecA/RadA family phage recombinase